MDRLQTAPEILTRRVAQQGPRVTTDPGEQMDAMLTPLLLLVHPDRWQEEVSVERLTHELTVRVHQLRAALRAS